MVTSRPTIKPGDKLPIGEASRVLGIHRNTLRRYTEEGRIQCTFDSAFSKLYTGKEILRFWDAR